MSFVVFFSFGVLVNAEENELTEEEVEYLTEVVGFSEEEISILSVDLAREFVENEAVIIDSFSELTDMEKDVYESDLITPMAELKRSKVRIDGKIIEMKSDWTGYKRFHALGNFEWVTQPVFTLTDGFSIGFPDNLGVVFKTNSNGSINGHSSQYYIYNQVTKKRTNISSKTSPARWETGLGVGATYKLSPQGSLQKDMRHGGHIGQTFYVSNKKSGKSNVKFEYGHKRVSGSISFSALPSGIGVSVSSTTDISSPYGRTFSY